MNFLFKYYTKKYLYNIIVLINGEYSSAGRASDCGSEGQEFETLYSPHIKNNNQINILLLIYYIYHK
jgi:hypothetical protein